MVFFAAKIYDEPKSCAIMIPKLASHIARAVYSMNASCELYWKESSFSRSIWRLAIATAKSLLLLLHGGDLLAL